MGGLMFVMKHLASPVIYGVSTVLHCCLSPSINSDYEAIASSRTTLFIPWAKKGHALHWKAGDEALAKRLWHWCEEKERDWERDESNL
jgi:hypothetical protein